MLLKANNIPLLEGEADSIHKSFRCDTIRISRVLNRIHRVEPIRQSTIASLLTHNAYVLLNLNKVRVDRITYDVFCCRVKQVLSSMFSHVTR